MGLDQFAYTAAKEAKSAARELAYWRKHPNLHGWMEQLWLRKSAHQLDENVEYDESSKTFNGVELELTWDDLTQLEQDILSGNMASLQTVGFFFGNASDDYYKEQDLEFVRQAKAEIFSGLRVFYNSSW